MKMQRIVNLAWIGICACLGGIISENLFHGSADAVARELYENAREVLRDSKGKVRIDMGVYTNNQPSVNLIGEDGRLRMQQAIADGSSNGGDGGLPITSLYDNNGRQRLLLRLAGGKNQSPMLVMRDSRQRDRLIIGLHVNDAGEEPYMVIIDKTGAKHTLFGEF